MAVSRRPSRRRVSLYGVAATALLFGESAGLGIDFTCDDGLGAVTVRGHSTNLQNVGVDTFLTNTTTSPKMVMKLDGTLGWTPHNLFTYSEQFNNAAWVVGALGTGATPTVTANAGTAPDGTTTADRIQYSLGGGTTSGDQSFIKQTATVPSGASGTASYYIKSYDGSTYHLLITKPDGSEKNITVTSTWQQFETTSAGIGSAAFFVYTRGGRTPTNENTVDILLWGAQLNRGTVPTRYLATTTAARYSVPIEYDLVLRQYYGLVEPAGTNLLTQNRNLSTADWNQFTGDAPISTNNVGPDGTATASRFTWDGSGSEFRYHTNITVTAAVHTLSFFHKSADASTHIFGVREANTEIIEQTVTSTTSWQRATITFTALAATNYAFGFEFRPGVVTGVDATGSVLITDIQLETGSIATSPIPTFAATVTRAADAVNVATTAFPLSVILGMFLVDFIPNILAVQGITGISDTTVNEQLLIYNSNTGGTVLAETTDGGVSQTILAGASTLVAGTRVKIALAFAINDFALVMNAGEVQTDTSATLPTVTQLHIGNIRGSGSPANMRIRSLVYLPRRATNAELQAKTR